MDGPLSFLGSVSTITWHESVQHHLAHDKMVVTKMVVTHALGKHALGMGNTPSRHTQQVAGGDYGDQRLLRPPPPF